MKIEHLIYAIISLSVAIFWSIFFADIIKSSTVLGTSIPIVNSVIFVVYMLAILRKEDRLIPAFAIIDFLITIYNLIVFYAGAYGSTGLVFSGGVEPVTDPFDFVYFSTVTFTTLGYGDIVPNTREAKFVVISEVFSGYIILALAIVVLLQCARTAFTYRVEA